MAEIIGGLTIGLAPRGDMEEWVPLGKKLIQDGVLNHVPPHQWNELSPEQGDNLLVTKADNREVHLDPFRIKPYMEKAAFNLLEKGAKKIVVLCSAPLTPINVKEKVLYPYDIIHEMVDLCVPEGQLGIIVPNADQIDFLKPGWERKNRATHFFPMSPYDTSYLSDHEVDELMRCEALVADCFGYEKEFAKHIQKRVHRPLFLIRDIVGFILNHC